MPHLSCVNSRKDGTPIRPITIGPLRRRHGLKDRVGNLLAAAAGNSG
jgi:hypothetical protein